MNKAGIVLFAGALLIIAGCSTVDVERIKIKEIEEENSGLGKNTPVIVVTEEEARERDIRKNGEQTNIISVREPIFVPYVEGTARPARTAEQVIENSLKDAMVTPQNFIGGTHIYDYNENQQFPVVARMLSLSVIQLEDGETPIGQPYLSDTLRWEITGDVWRTNEGKSVQLIMLKPMEVGLKTNMIVITNRRIYQFVLSSTNNSYMPMIKFRYPFEMQFITERVIAEREQAAREKEAGYYLSYNYKIVAGWVISGWFKPEWTPVEAWDDGHKTYIRLPRMVLQKEYPVIFEKRNYIVNYRLQENVMILDKLVEDVTLRLNRKRVRVIKKKGEAEDLRRYVKNPIEVVVDEPVEEAKGYVFEVTGDAVWKPKKVVESNNETILIFETDHFIEGGLYIVDDEGKEVEYMLNGNIITIPKVINRIIVAYNLETVEVLKK
jgi:type IV secretion system protein VirB9